MSLRLTHWNNVIAVKTHKTGNSLVYVLLLATFWDQSNPTFLFLSMPSL